MAGNFLKRAGRCARDVAVQRDGNETALAEFVERIEHLDEIVRTNTGSKPEQAGPPLRVFVLRNVAAVRAMSGANPRLAGFYAPNLRGPIAVIHREKPDHPLDQTGAAILFHEYAHHFMLQDAPIAYPSWYVEGFAEYYSSVEFHDDGDIVVGDLPPPLVSRLVAGNWLPIPRLFQPAHTLSNRERGMLYAQGWLLTHYLCHSPERNARIGRYMLR